MTDPIPNPQLERAIRAALAAPAASPEFVTSLRERLAGARLTVKQPAPPLRLAWAAALVILLVMVAGTLIIGPQRVYAAVRQFIGYLPGFGLVDQGAPLRMLAEPVSVTRGGVTVSVNQGLLTAEDTRLDYGISGVPLSAYPGSEAVTGCLDQPYLRLPGGATQDITAPIPPAVNEVIFVLPCIFNTLPDTVPTDWELPLRLIPAPPELTMLPVIEVATPPVLNETTEEPVALSAEIPSAVSQELVVERIIETGDGYILIGAFRPLVEGESWVELTGAPLIRDANGRKVTYSYPEDIDLPYDDSLGQGGFTWAFRIEGAGLSFPLSIYFSGVTITPLDPSARAEVEFDAGADPQPGQEWVMNRELQLAGYSFKLVSVAALAEGYSFTIEPGEQLRGVSVQIAGHAAVGGGGGVRSLSLVYSELPNGRLTLVFSNPLVSGPTQEWSTLWMPDNPHPEWASAAAAPASVCLDAAMMMELQNIPDGLDGWMLMTELNPEMRLVLQSFDAQRRVLAAPGSRGALSPDGTQAAYPGEEGLYILDLLSGESTLLPGLSGYDLHWSPDGQRIALINANDAFGVFVVNRDGSGLRQLSNLGYESIAGWSPDGSELYYAVPDAGGEGWMLKAVSTEQGSTREVILLKGSSRKAPRPAISPDGRQVAYRAQDNASLYIAGLDGSAPRLLLDQPALAISGIVWEKEGHLLGISLITEDSPDGDVILLQIDTCQVYRIPGMHGELNGISLP